MSGGSFWHSSKGKLVLALIPMVIVWGIILLNFVPSMEGLLPNDDDLESLRNEIKKEKTEFENQDRKKRASDQMKKEYGDRLKTFWQEDTDGDVELGLREMVEQTAKNGELKLTSLGSVRTTKINSNLCYAELDVSMTDSLENVAKFLELVRKLTPVISWKRADMRLDMRPPNRQQQDAKNNSMTSVNTTGKARTTNAPEQAAVTALQLRFSGTIRVICQTAAEAQP